MTPEIKDRFDKEIRENKIVIYMKGNQLFPACGFSQRAVALLKPFGKLHTVDVLTEPGVLDGAVEHPVTLDWAAFRALPQVEDESDFHCVTTWSLLDSKWKGVQFSTLAALAHPVDAATHVMTYAYDGYTTNVPLAEALKD